MSQRENSKRIILGLNPYDTRPYMTSFDDRSKNMVFHIFC